MSNPFKQLNKLFGGSKKKKKDEEAQEDLMKRAHFVVRDVSQGSKKANEQRTLTSNILSDQNELSHMDYQKQYLSEKMQRQQEGALQDPLNFKENDAENFDPERYKSIHENEFKKIQNTDEDDYQFLEKPMGEEERIAYAKADYQTRLKIERANFNQKKVIYDKSQVNEGHKNVKPI